MVKFHEKSWDPATLLLVRSGFFSHSNYTDIAGRNCFVCLLQNVKKCPPIIAQQIDHKRWCVGRWSRRLSEAEKKRNWTKRHVLGAWRRNFGMLNAGESRKIGPCEARRRCAGRWRRWPFGNGKKADELAESVWSYGGVGDTVTKKFLKKYIFCKTLWPTCHEYLSTQISRECAAD